MKRWEVVAGVIAAIVVVALYVRGGEEDQYQHCIDRNKALWPGYRDAPPQYRSTIEENISSSCERYRTNKSHE